MQTIQRDGANVNQVINRYDTQGNLATSSRGVHKEGSNDYFTSKNIYTSTLTDRWRTSSIVATRSDNTGNPGETTYTYDVNGFLTGIADSDKAGNGRSFQNTFEGVILQKMQEGNVVRNIVANGQVLGSYGTGVDVDDPTNDDGSPRYVAIRDFDLGYQDIDLAHPGTGSGTYRVASGDNLRGIAQAAYGDAQLWYLIADANGLRGDGDLRVGQVLTLPSNVSGMHNNASTFKPYDPASIVGDTSPFVNGANGSNCAQVGIIVAAVLVAVVITVATAGAATAAGAAIAASLGTVGAAIATTTAAAVGGAVGGALGSAASQGIMIAGGLQKEFSWSEVGIGALTGFVGGGLAGGAGTVAGAVFRGSTTFAATVLRGALDCAQKVTLAAKAGRALALSAGYAALNVTADAIGQGVRIAIGQQGGFDWRSTASAALAGAFSGAGGTVGRQGSVRALGGGVVADLMGSAIDNGVANDGRFDPTQFAADAAASLGSAVTGRIAASKRQACFVAGTVIHTRNGPLAVERFVGGELVLARDEKTGETGMRAVLNTKATPDMPIHRVTVRNAEGRTETLRTTEEHPFWVKGNGWVKAALLTVDDVLLDLQDRDMTIVDVAVEEARETVYNIEVAQFHTYHVGELGVWVHNANCPRKRAAEDPLAADGAQRQKVAPGVMYRKDKFYLANLRGIPGPLTHNETMSLDARVARHIASGIRPAYKAGLVDTVWNAARRHSSGRVFDPNGMSDGTSIELRWDKSRSRQGQWDMGHTPGNEYWKMEKTFLAHAESYDGPGRRMDGRTFLLDYNNPEHYRPEYGPNNRSHQFEAPD
ncbi:MAG: polymorphic toxin-type HINT domain-containing protein [Ramlibacter sp.]